MNRRVNSEYSVMNAVMLYRPDSSVGDFPDPESILHLAPINQSALMQEFDSIESTFNSLGISVLMVDDQSLSADQNYRYNMMYCRDLFFMTPKGAIIAQMANDIRAAEPLYATRTLQRHGVPLLHTVSGAARFEGADALWIREDLVLLGTGNRSNRQGFEQVSAVLEKQEVRCVEVPSKQTRTQHLLGTVQVVDRNLALVRYEITAPEIVRLLEDYGISCVLVPENEEVVGRQAMNIVTVAPRSIVMTAGCPETRRLFVQAGLTIAAELEISQLLRGAGGLACATGIVGREHLLQR